MSDVDAAARPEPEGGAVTAMVNRASLEIGPLAAEGMATADQAAERRMGSPGWCAPGAVAAAARLAVAAWAMAVAGDEALLARICDPTQARFLLHPYRKDWVIAPGPVVSRISVWALDTEPGDLPGLDLVTLRASWDFTGAQRLGDPGDQGDPGDPAGGWHDPGDTEFTGMLALTLAGEGKFPWRLTHAHVDTIDDALGYTFRTRDETPQEYRERAGGDAGTDAAPLAPSGGYRLVAGFTEPDFHVGGEATAEVASDPPPTRAQAQRIAQEAVDAAARREIARVLPGWDPASGEVRPSLTSVELIRLLEAAPQPARPADVAAQPRQPRGR